MIERGHPEVPRWTRDLDALLRRALRAAPLLAYATPTNFAAEVARLEQAALVAGDLVPRFTYRPPPEDALHLAPALVQRATELGEDGLEGVYARRALQLARDLLWANDLAEGGALSGGRARFAPRGDGFDDAADALAASWLRDAATWVERAASGGPHPAGRGAASGEEAFEALSGGDVVSDDEADPRSLVRRMREVVGARRLPVRVVVVKGIAPLAAAGDGVVQIAAGRRLGVDDVERTVAHEVDGHLVPACRAAENPLGIFAIGTAHGSDDQEGRALLVERRAGHLGPLRRRTLALRHVAARAVHAGAAFDDVVRRLGASGAFPREAVRLAARAARGRGLGREVVYLPAMLRVEAAVAAAPAIDRVLGAGRVGVDDAEALAPWVL